MAKYVFVPANGSNRDLFCDGRIVEYDVPDSDDQMRSALSRARVTDKDVVKVQHKGRPDTLMILRGRAKRW